LCGLAGPLFEYRAAPPAMSSGVCPERSREFRRRRASAGGTSHLSKASQTCLARRFCGATVRSRLLSSSVSGTHRFIERYADLGHTSAPPPIGPARWAHIRRAGLNLTGSTANPLRPSGCQSLGRDSRNMETVRRELLVMGEYRLAALSFPRGKTQTHTKAGRRAAVQQADPWPRAALHARPKLHRGH